MPTAFRCDGFRFFFYYNEGDPREPIHIHVMGPGGEAKIGLTPEISLADSERLHARTLRHLIRVVEENRTARSAGRAIAVQSRHLVDRVEDESIWL